MFRFLLAFFLMLSATEVFAQYVIPQGYHAHRTLDGKILVHKDTNYGNPRAHANVAYPWIVIARAGQVINDIKVTTTKPQPVISIMPRFSTPIINNYYIEQPRRIIPFKSNCPGGNCPR